MNSSNGDPVDKYASGKFDEDDSDELADDKAIIADMYKSETKQAEKQLIIDLEKKLADQNR